MLGAVNLFRTRSAPNYIDGQRLEIGGLVVRLKVNDRSRRISLRIDRLGREAVASAPSLRLLAEAAAFAEARKAWIAERIAAVPAPTALKPGDVVQVFGEARRLDADGRRPRFAPRKICGCGDGVIDIQLVARAIRREARSVYQARAAIHCDRLGVATPPILVTDTKSRWGSCSPARPGRPATIRISWRLALAPPAVADYVVAHECAHLREANHGPRFWVLVTDLVGDQRPHRAWLRARGGELHAFGA